LTAATYKIYNMSHICKQLFGAEMRHERDFYPTPQSIIDAILFHVKLRETATIWEPCAGDGRFSTALEQSWKSAQAPIIVTNPPFKHIRPFINHAFKIGVEEMVLVTPERLWACQKGYDQLLRHRPSRFANLTWREDYLQIGGSPDRSLAVCIWDSPCAETTAYEVWQRTENEIECEVEQTSPVFHYKDPIPCDFCGALTRGEIVDDLVQCDACHAVLV
jgi:hypothetical protein